MLRQLHRVKRIPSNGENIVRSKVLLLLGAAGVARRRVEVLLAGIETEKRARDEEFRALAQDQVERVRAKRLKAQNILSNKWGEISGASSAKNLARDPVS